MTNSRFDYVVVGAGTSGCVLAERLSADPAISVLLVESGPSDRHPLISMPMGIGRLMTPDSPHYWHFQASKGGNRGTEDWVKGRTLGGSSSVNGMVYVRGMPADYDAWEALGATGWSWKTISRCFREIEDHQLGAGGDRGIGGPLKVSVPTRNDVLVNAVLEAARQAGSPIVQDINDPATELSGAFGRQPCTIANGRRWSAATAFLHPVISRKNLTVMARTDMVGLVLDGRRAVGVNIRHKGQRRTVDATRDIILSAGAINSPRLLQLSGIGPGRLLRSLNMEVVLDLPGVGANLIEHRTMSTVFRLKRGGKNAGLRAPGVYLSALRYFLTRTGPLATSMFDVGGFSRSSDEHDRPDLQIGIGLHSFGSGGVNSFPGMTMYGYQMRPESRGTMEITSADPEIAPRIDANYLATPADRRHLVGLVRQMRKIAEQPALRSFVAEELLPGPSVQSDDDIIEESFRYGSPSYHVAGTCRMGTDEMAVVAPDLRVRGIDGLRVVDTSIMPQLSGNTNGPAMALAWRAAELILGRS